MVHNFIRYSQSPTNLKIGDGATITWATDREAGSIVRIVNEREIHVQIDDKKRLDKNGMSDAQTYEYSANDQNPVYIFTRRKNGTWVRQGEDMGSGLRAVFGIRDAYFDYCY